MQYNKDIYWMKIALKYAFFAQKKGEIPIGSIIVYEERIIGIGWNSSIIQHDPTAHAEIIALRHAGKTIKNYRLKNSTLYVTLEPCIMCFGAIIHSRIQRLVFGANNKKFNQNQSLKNFSFHSDKNYNLNIQNNIMQYECENILVNFFQKKRNKIK
ncbi:tRNA adenosine(34) deaminase TadA [Buchnera aphidicola]|uniref:tRNA-specific adenosine deaminase n=1 Tax=Buchnera aphidicola subsp. Uroleucon sonchi TaxID=118118 RepID=A0A6C1F703_BUCUN|nr:tRNA adenosine(34) deaminase TadA [Buchnera aphidicola]QIE02281.1 tRNA adenosine(34) deaminase TadA [Buchnera aphidicola (Uroleucon sonchi)]